MNSNTNRTDKILILYHANCIDGFTAAWACRKGLIMRGAAEESIYAVAATYGNLESILIAAEAYTHVYIVDLSLKPSIIKALPHKHVVVLDHHKTALEMYSNTDEGDFDISTYTYNSDRVKIIIDMNECGASLVWRYFFVGREIPELIRYVKDHDLWTHLDEDTKYINKYLMTKSKGFGTWDGVYDCLSSLGAWKPVIIADGKAMHTYHMFMVDSALTAAISCELAGEVGLVVNCPGNLASEVGHALALKSGTYGASWSQIGNDIKWSLRSIGDYDVALLAQKFGGGGHKNAAGFTLSAPRKGQMFPDADSEVGMAAWLPYEAEGRN